jgi:hypothetical protein
MGSGAPERLKRSGRPERVRVAPEHSAPSRKRRPHRNVGAKQTTPAQLRCPHQKTVLLFRHRRPADECKSKDAYPERRRQQARVRDWPEAGHVASAKPALAFAKPIQSARGAAIKTPHPAPNLIRSVCENSPAQLQGRCGVTPQKGSGKTAKRVGQQGKAFPFIVANGR